jgi:thiol:disulfide interchange protein
VALGAALTLGAGRTAMGAAENWNDAQIKWMPYTEGLAAAKKTHRPICLIFHTTWCPHCANYSTVFSDPRVADKAKSFVMIRLDKDQNRELSKQYSPDGEYIPRTYFLSPQGKLDESLTEGRAQFKYFYNEKDPASLLAGMDRALKKFQ